MAAPRQASIALSSCSSNSDFLLIDAIPTSDDCIVTKLNRRAFINDIITKSFPAPLPPLSPSGKKNNKSSAAVATPAVTVSSTGDNCHVVLSQHVDDDGDEDEDEETLCLDSDLGDIGQSPSKDKRAMVGDEDRVILSSSTSSAAKLQEQNHMRTLQQLRQRLLGTSTSGDDDDEGAMMDDAQQHSRTFPFDATVARLISPDVWPRIYRQFELDVKRQEFLIETEKFTNAAEAYRSIRQMMHATLVQKLLKERQRRAAANQRRRPIISTAKVAAKAWSLLSPVLGRTLDRWRRQDQPAAGAAAASTTTSADAQRVDPSKVHIDPHESVDAPLDDEVYSEELIAAAERMTRLVILFSQQSVMGLPFEELYRRYLVHVDRVLHLDSDAARNGAMFVQLTAAPSTATTTTTSSASSELGGSAASVASSFASVNYPSPQQHQHHARGGSGSSGGAGGQPSSVHMPPPPPPLFDGKRHHHSPLVTAPTLRIHKRFRVFEIIDADDDNNGDDHRNRRAQCDDDGVTHTLFTIDTDIIIDLFASESVPIIMTWMIEQPSPRRVSTRTPVQPIATVAAPVPPVSREDAVSFHADANDDVATYVPQQDCLTYIPNSATQRSREDSAANVARGDEGSTLLHQQRVCDCLGGPYGFHRADCHVVVSLRQKIE